MRETTYEFVTVAATHFTGGLAQDAAEVETMPGLRGDGKGHITDIIVKSKQQLAWQVELYDTDGGIVQKFAFEESDGTLESTWYYYVKSVSWGVIRSVSADYIVTMGVRNLSVTSKIAGASGYVVLKVKLLK